jgi:hemoglobin-like flavoprotein
MDPELLTVVKDSYTRCLRGSDFLPAFYRHFFRACPAAEPLFARTDLDRQARLLQHALGLLLTFPKEPPGEPSLLTRLAAKHGPGEMNINPAWYPLFLQALVETAEQFDPEFTPALADAWRAVLTPGLAYMQSYGRPAD